MDNNINYSIIIPHKIIPELLRRCLKSIPRRDDIQIIVVDDNSNNIIVNFNNFPGMNEKCVEVYFTKEGKGAGYARNVALAHVKGKWILFADADDKFNDGFLEITDNYINSKYDIVYFGVNGLTEQEGLSYRNYVYDNRREEAISKGDPYLYYFKIYQPWGKLFSTRLINHNLFFDETFVSNDRMFSVKATLYAERITYDVRKIYTSYSRSDSLIQQKNLQSEMIKLTVDCRVNVFLKENDMFKYRVNIFHSLMRGTSHSGIRMLISGVKLILCEYRDIFVIEDLTNFIKLIPSFIKRKIDRLT
jgi:glycosyltransferase involved in cell wall biosynthesis